MLLPVLLDKDSHFIYCYDGLTPPPLQPTTIDSHLLRIATEGRQLHEMEKRRI